MFVQHIKYYKLYASALCAVALILSSVGCARLHAQRIPEMECNMTSAHQLGVKNGRSDAPRYPETFEHCGLGSDKQALKQAYLRGYEEGEEQRLAEQRQQLDQDPALVCDRGIAREKGTQDGWARQYNISALDGGELKEMRATAVRAYKKGYRLGKELFFKEACDKDKAEQRGFEAGRAGEPSDPEMTMACPDDDARTSACRSYERGYEQGRTHRTPSEHAHRE